MNANSAIGSFLNENSAMGIPKKPAFSTKNQDHNQESNNHQGGSTIRRPFFLPATESI